MTDLTVLFLLTATGLVLTPGPDMLFATAQALTRGRVGAIAATVGLCLGYLAHTALAAGGLTALLAGSSDALTCVRCAGAAYMAWLGLHLLVSRPRPEPTVEQAGARPLNHPIRDGFLVSFLNPKGLLFFFAFLPQFVDPTGAITLQLLAYGAAFTAICFVVYGALALLAARARSHFAGSGSRWISRITGTVLLCLAARLAVISPS